ncbi:Phenylacetic acid catabolic protein [Blastococcus brunescens]|uniref:Phenylacetic acid catabolic protein n=1 Tax=Blastococcus brunescens TaxID=1564165 RepID=A0ABZ1B3T1_9ACTN|nr:Phenylacetic acid catabolic protein [Blastococcus sp. BMG 8361]WRL65469.1 Phenylacetic acid catabolic protein [Blastococcus sp. BMG 8361]
MESRLVDAGVAVDPAGVRDEVRSVLTQVLDQATLRVPAWPADAPPLARHGEHGEVLTELLAGLQGLARKHPAATW